MTAMARDTFFPKSVKENSERWELSQHHGISVSSKHSVNIFYSYRAVTPDEHQTRTRRQTAPVPVTAQPAAARHEGNQSGGTGAQACPEHDSVCDYMSLSLSITSHLFYHLHVSYMIVCQELTFPTPHLPVA